VNPKKEKRKTPVQQIQALKKKKNLGGGMGGQKRPKVATL